MTLSRRQTFKAFLITALAYGKAMRGPSLIDEAKRARWIWNIRPAKNSKRRSKSF